MEIILYKYGKRENSTARPTGGTAYQCRLKTDCSVVSPTIEIDMGSATAWPDYNYAFIDTFHRYYSISNITASKGIWILQLDTDVLATYKPIIAEQDFFIERCSYEYDGNVPDNMYPMLAGVTQHIESARSPWQHVGTEETINITNGGCFVIGVVSKEISQARYGSIVYYALTRDSLNTLVDALLQDSLLTSGTSPFDANDASLALQKAIVDPLSFIKSAYWVPVTYDSISSAYETQTLNIWTWTINAPNKFIGKNPPYVMYTGAVPITKHPQSASRGAWLNLEPWTRMSILIPPFGLIDLDTSMYINETSVNYTVTLDLITGICTLLIRAGSTRTHCLKSQVSVPIPLSQVITDYAGAAAGMLGGLAAATASLFTGNALGVLGGLGVTVGSAAGALKPHESSIGGNGSFSELHGSVYLYEDFYRPSAEDNTNMGRPLCGIRKPKNIPGYIKCLHGSCPIPGTRGEQEKVQQYLERGFYYE